MLVVRAGPDLLARTSRPERDRERQRERERHAYPGCRDFSTKS